MTTLYRADVDGRTEIPGASSWTSSYAHASECASGALVGFGGPRIFSVEIPSTAAVADLRTDAAGGFEGLGLDLDDYEHSHLRDLLRDLAELLRTYGFEWVAFHDWQDRPEADYDEWIYLGAEPIKAVRFTG